MEKYVTAAAWYLLGIGLYFVYNFFCSQEYERLYRHGSKRLSGASDFRRFDCRSHNNCWSFVFVCMADQYGR